ncbi:MAG: glycosyltransferase, partial [Bdellovibrionaceae bacterium]|nr:glycosyltransferase [Pseudobdellovibrionaceae bacterium]
MPRVSVITPVYNSAPFLPATLKSVVEQSFSDFEHLLVIDAKSTDASAEIAHAAAKKDPRVRVVVHPENLGVAANRNRGIELARGEWLAFLDADDLWLPRKLEMQLELAESTGSRLLCSGYEIITPTGGPTGRKRIPPEQAGFGDLLAHNSVGCLTALVHREALGELRFDPSVLHEDYLLWLQLAERHGHFTGLAAVTAQYRLSPNSRS